MTAPLEHLSRNDRLARFFIDGEWREPWGTAKGVVVNPATEEVVTRFSLGNGEDVNAAVSAARAAFATWSRTKPEYRAGLLDRLQALLEARSELLAQCLTLEMGAAIGYARTAQVPLAIAHVRVARNVLTAFPFVEQRGHTAVTHEPIGVCALITPWNWPLYQITAKVAPALAAGCTVVLKPSELSPLDALLFAEATEEAGFPAGVFNLVNGNGPCVGAGLASHADVDMISITGSTAAGIAVAQAAAPTVKRVAQELGGKSPNVILPDAALDRAVSLGIAAAFRNLGQSCSAPTRMIVPRALLSEIETIAKQAADEIVVGDPLSETTTHGAITNRAQFDRIQTMIGVGISEGAKVVTGGQGRPGGLNAGLYVKPTIFSEVRTGMRVAQEEIFIEHDASRLAPRVHEEHIYGWLEEPALHALRDDLTIPMILLARYSRILREHNRPKLIDRRKNDGHLEPALLKENQDLPNLLCSVLEIHRRNLPPNVCDSISGVLHDQGSRRGHGAWSR
jgi:aldehyde dehydrogenase (NAD+)